MAFVVTDSVVIATVVVSVDIVVVNFFAAVAFDVKDGVVSVVVDADKVVVSFLLLWVLLSCCYCCDCCCRSYC